ncbi:hypothetical protein B0H16DRAFT_1607403 [Mycena metata]|uniref:Uncharacterized protein n=1 Tax=Mycena metata TaxID=1033252 RepID=A0AAD7HF42_9AGAR|nr:hypothetical protein B0H16DRAFT_1607403 [Mycena metata]
MLRILDLVHATPTRLSNCIQFLRNSPRLETATFNIGYVLARDIPVQSVLTHSSLRHFSLSRTAGELLSLLCLPALSSVSLGGVATSVPLVTAFLARSSNSLRTFTYAQNHRDGLSVEWFRIVADLTAVHLKGVRADSQREFVLTLHRVRHDDFLPHLLSLELAGPRHVVDGAAIAALSSRYPEKEPIGWSRLNSLRVVCSDRGASMPWKDIGEVDWDSLVSLGNRGMEIHIGTGEENYLWEEHRVE